MRTLASLVLLLVAPAVLDGGATSAQRPPAPTAQGADAMRPRERRPSAVFRARTPGEQALLDSIMALAQQEAHTDTNLIAGVTAALASMNPNLRANAMAALQIAMISLRSAPGSRGPARRVVLSDQAWPIAMRGLADAEGSVRRYALMALSSMERSRDRSPQLAELARRLFEEDAEGVVRAAAFGLLVELGPRDAVDLTLVERAVADPSSTVKSSGFNLLWLRQAPGHLPFMLQKLHDEQDAGTRVAAAEALRNVVPVDPTVVDAVSARLGLETDADVRRRMAAALAQMKEFAAKVRTPGA
jgi:HEAT repeat protein